jgi:hypothetical protein
MSNGALAILEIFKDVPPLRWYHFIAPLGFVAFILFCVGYTLWGLIT